MSSAPKPAPILLAPALASDLDHVMAIMGRAFPPDFGEAWTRSQCAGIMTMSGVVLMLAGTGAKAASGFSLLRTVADEAELLLIAVDPVERRCGVGRALLHHFIDHSKGVGATRLHLEVRDGNSAIAMYHDAKFEVAGRRRNYYRGLDGSHYDALTMVHQVTID